MVHFSHPYMTSGKTSFDCTFVGKVMSLLFNMLSRFVIAFLPRSKYLLISWLQSPLTVILEPKKIKSVTVSIFSPLICHEVMGLDAMIFVFWMLSFKSAFSPSSRGSLVPLSFLPLGWSRSKCKSSSDVADTAKKHQSIMMDLEAQRKDERQEEVTEEPKRFTTQEIARGFSLFEEALLVFETLKPNVKQYMNFAATVQNAIYATVSSMMRKKKELLPIKRIYRVESSTEPDPVPWASGVSEIAVCPPSPILMVLQLYHLPPLFPPPISNSSCLFTWCQTLYAKCCTILLYFSRCCTVRLNMFSFIFSVCFLCIICLKSITNLLQYSPMWLIVLVGYLG